MTTVQSDVREVKQFIGGDVGRRRGRATFDDLDPFTGDVVARVAGRRAAPTPRGRSRRRPRRSPPGRRRRRPSGSAIFLKAADILESRLDEVVALLARETGAPSGSGCSRCGFVPGLLRQAAALAYAPIGQIIPSDHPGTFAMGMRQPVGVVGAIAPWNAALILSARSIAAPLALGNTVVLKPSELSPVGRRPALGRDLRRGGAARGRAQHRHARARRGRPDRRRARREPGRAPDQLHRLDRDRPPARRGARGGS